MLLLLNKRYKDSDSWFCLERLNDNTVWDTPYPTSFHRIFIGC